MMSVLAIGVGWAETVFYTLDGSIIGGNNGYATVSDITQDGMSWKVTGNTQMSPWRIGGKSLTKVDRDAYSTTAMGSSISKIELKVGQITCTLNSVKLTVASDASFSNILDQITKSSVSANSTLEFTPSSGTDWAKNAYYKFTFNVTCGSSSNFYVQLTKATFYNNPPSDIATPVISGTTPFEGSTQVTITCATTGASIYYTTDGNEPTASSLLYNAPFTITQTTTVKAIAELNGQTSNIATKSFTATPIITTIAEFNNLAVNDNFKYTGNNLVYIKSNPGGNNHYVQDGLKGMLIYGSLGQTYQPGDVIPGGFTGTRAEYNGAPEMTNPAGFTASSQNVGLTPLEITYSDVTIDNFGRYVVIKNSAIDGSNLVVDGQNVSFHNSLGATLPTNTEGKLFNVKGVVGAYNGNAQILPIEFEEITIVTDAEYYLIGSFNGWAQQDENYKFTALADGSYRLNNTMPDGVRFKILKVDGSNVSWLGGSAGDYFGITKDVCTNIQLVDGADFYMEVGGNCTFIVSADQKLTVSKEAQLFLAGTFNNWGKTDALEATSDGWTIEKELSINDEFKFVDEWGTWYGGGNTIAEANLGSSITLNNGDNFKMAVDGDFVINVSTNKSSFVITRKAETTTAMFNFNDDYATLFPDLDLTTLPYEILEPITATVDGISVTVSAATSGTTNKIWNNNNKLRVYSGTITVTAPEGYNLTGIEFTNHSSNFNLSPSDGEMGGSGSARTWSGVVPTLVLTAGSNTQIGTMTVSVTKANSNAPVAPVIEGESPFVGSTQVTITCATNGASVYYTTDGNDPTSSSTLYQGPFTISESVTVKAIAYSEGGVPSTITTKEFVKTPSVATIAQYKQLAAGTTFVFTGNVAVTYVNGKYLYIKDDTGSALIFGNSNFDFTQGQVLETGWKAETTDYNGLLEAKNPVDVSATDQTVEIAPEEKAVNAISTTNDNEYIIVTNVSIDEPVNKNFTITDANGNTIVGRTNFTGVDHPTDLDAKYDITCLVGEYNGTVQLYPTEYNAAAVIEPVVLDGVAFTADRQWATWYGDASLALPEDVTAYVVTGVQGDAVAVEALDYIPAGTGVLLYSETAAESVSAMPYTGEAGTIPTNLLVGGLEAQTVSNAYLLYNNQFILAQDGTTVGAHRCYLPMSASAQGVPVLKIGTPGTVTGVETINTSENSDNTYYNLMGQPVANPTPGIYIRGGKKVIVK